MKSGAVLENSILMSCSACGISFFLLRVLRMLFRAEMLMKTEKVAKKPRLKLV
jgi:hypothetical protein